MSDPRTDYNDPLDGAISELISAMSALNMEPDPVVPADPPPGQPLFLVDVDAWAKHAETHMHAAVQAIRKAHVQREVLRTALAFVAIDIREGRLDRAQSRIDTALEKAEPATAPVLSVDQLTVLRGLVRERLNAERRSSEALREIAAHAPQAHVAEARVQALTALAELLADCAPAVTP